MGILHSGVRVHDCLASQFDHERPPAELIVTGYWTGKTKDRLVGLDLHEDFGRAGNVCLVFGVCMIIWAVWGTAAMIKKNAVH